MKKSWINYWVDMVIGVAFILCGVTGLMRMFPDATVGLSAAGKPVILGISTSVWQVVHDWSGFVMTAGVGVHLALHFKWMVSMTRKALRGEDKTTAKRRATPRPPRPAASAGTVVAPVPAGTAPVAVTVGPLGDGPEGSLARLQAMSPGRPQGGRAGRTSASDKPRYSRKGFLVATGAVGVAAFMAGCGLLSSSDNESTSLSTTSTGRNRYRQDDAYDGSANRDQTGTGSNQSDGNSSGATTTTSERVVVDSGRCTGCGNCVQMCPYGVFTMSGGKSVVQNPDACRLCGHCLRACAPGAITLNG